MMGGQEVYTEGLPTPLQLLEGTRRLWLPASIRLKDPVILKFPSLPLHLPSQIQIVPFLQADFEAFLVCSKQSLEWRLEKHVSLACVLIPALTSARFQAYLKMKQKSQKKPRLLPQKPTQPYCGLYFS